MYNYMYSCLVTFYINKCAPKEADDRLLSKVAIFVYFYIRAQM